MTRKVTFLVEANVDSTFQGYGPICSKVNRAHDLSSCNWHSHSDLASGSRGGVGMTRIETGLPDASFTSWHEWATFWHRSSHGLPAVAKSQPQLHPAPLHMPHVEATFPALTPDEVCDLDVAEAADRRADKKRRLSLN